MVETQAATGLVGGTLEFLGGDHLVRGAVDDSFDALDMVLLDGFDRATVVAEDGHHFVEAEIGAEVTFHRLQQRLEVRQRIQAGRGLQHRGDDLALARLPPVIDLRIVVAHAAIGERRGAGEVRLLPLLEGVAGIGKTQRRCDVDPAEVRDDLGQAAHVHQRVVIDRHVQQLRHRVDAHVRAADGIGRIELLDVEHRLPDHLRHRVPRDRQHARGFGLRIDR